MKQKKIKKNLSEVESIHSSDQLMVDILNLEVTINNFFNKMILSVIYYTTIRYYTAKKSFMASKYYLLYCNCIITVIRSNIVLVIFDCFYYIKNATGKIKKQSLESTIQNEFTKIFYTPKLLLDSFCPKSVISRKID